MSTRGTFSFTMVDGKAKWVLLSEAIKNKDLDLLHIDKKDGAEFCTIPKRRKETARRIEKVVRARYGADASGTGYYRENEPFLEFAPDKDGSR
jgi:hypothetical protein